MLDRKFRVRVEQIGLLDRCSTRNARNVRKDSEAKTLHIIKAGSIGSIGSVRFGVLGEFGCSTQIGVAQHAIGLRVCYIIHSVIYWTASSHPIVALYGIVVSHRHTASSYRIVYRAADHVA